MAQAEAIEGAKFVILELSNLEQNAEPYFATHGDIKRDFQFACYAACSRISDFLVRVYFHVDALT